MRSLCLFVCLLTFVQCFGHKITQEGAKNICCNKKYVSECSGITRRLGRGEPYKTNMTAVIKYPWDNNVTLKVVIHSGLNIDIVNSKLCEIPKVKWLSDYLQTYSNINGDCPYKPGLYGFYNMEFPPKNMPMAIATLVNRKFYTSFMFIVTKTEEVIVANSILFYYDTKHN